VEFFELKPMLDFLVLITLATAQAKPVLVSHLMRTLAGRHIHQQMKIQTMLKVVLV